MTFFPLRGIDVTPERFGIPYREVPLTTADGETVYLWVLPHPEARAEVLYLHGNGGNLSVWSEILAGIHRQGLTVAALDYRGYGKSSGSPSERGLYRDTEAAVRYVHEQVRTPGLPLVYWGRSLGVPMAAFAATIAEPDGLILEAGFADKDAFLAHAPLTLRLLGLFSTYRFPAAELLRGVDRPVLVMHGDRDTVVPFEAGEELYRRLDGEKRFQRIRGGDHNDLLPPDPAAYWGAVSDFVEGLSQGAPRPREPHS